MAVDTSAFQSLVQNRDKNKEKKGIDMSAFNLERPNQQQTQMSTQEFLQGGQEPNPIERQMAFSGVERALGVDPFAEEEAMLRKATKPEPTPKEEALERVRRAKETLETPITKKVEFVSDIAQEINKNLFTFTKAVKDNVMPYEPEQKGFTPETEIMSQITGQPVGETRTVSDEGKEWANIFGWDNPPKWAVLGLGAASGMLDVADLMTPGVPLKVSAKKAARNLFDSAAKHGDAGLDRVSRDVLGAAQDDLSKETANAVELLKGMTKTSDSATDLENKIKSLNASSDLAKKAENTKSLDEFRKSLSQADHKQLSDIGLTDKNFKTSVDALNRVKRVDDTTVARTADDIPQDLAEEVRKFDSAEEFVEANRFNQKLWRGTGREEAKAAGLAVREGRQGVGNALGEGTYFAFDENVALKFGKQAEPHQVEIVNPAIIRNDEDFARFTNMTPASLLAKDAKAAKKNIQEARQRLINRGHDGVVVRLEEGGGARQVRRLFGDDQVVDFGVQNQVKSQLTDIFNRVKQGDEVTPRKSTLRSDMPRTEGQSAGAKTKSKPSPEAKHLQREGESRQLQKARSDAIGEIQARTSSLPDSTIDSHINQAQKSNLNTDDIPPSNKTVSVGENWRGTIHLPPETKFQAFRRTVEDFNIRLKVLNDEIEKVLGQKVKEHHDLWAKKDMLPRKQSDVIRRVRDKKKDFVKRMMKTGIHSDEFDEYLQAKHAKERNAKMNERRKERGLEPQEGLSGMTDKRADEILARDNSKFKPFEDEMRQLVRETLDFQVRAGLIKKSDADTIKEAYQNYVPLFRQMDEQLDASIGIGMSADVRGKDIKRAKGSTREVLSPTASIFAQRERAQIRALKNDVGKTIVEMTEEMPELKDIFQVEKQQFRPRFNSNGELQFLDPKWKTADNVLGTKIDGTQYFITINDVRTASAIKNLEVARVPKWVQYARVPLGLWSRLKTQLRPEFFAPVLGTNFQRDLGEALINLNVEKAQIGKKSKFIRTKIVKDTLPSQRRIWKYLRGAQDTEVDEFFRQGGDAGHFWLNTTQEASEDLKDIERQMRNEGMEKIKNPIRKLDRIMDDLNTMTELGVRFAAYRRLKEAGMSSQKAIQSAADLTLQFSRQGEMSPYLKAAYGFINPSIQGASKVMRSVASKQGGKRVVKAIGGLVALGYANRAISIHMDPEGDEQLSDWSKNHKLTFAIGNGNNVTLWNMPYGYTTFFAIGSNIAEMQFGNKTAREATGNITTTAVDSFSPFGTNISDWWPTLAAPLADINANKGWYGGQIRPEQVFTNTPKPNSETYFDNASKQAVFASQLLNRLSGGGDGKAGFIDMHPDDLEYAFDQYMGGPFEFVGLSIEAAARGVNGEFNPNNTPFVRRVIGENRVDSWSYGTIYDTLERSYKKDISDFEKQRFFRAVDTGLEEKVFDQEKADDFTQEFLRALYRVEGSINDDDTIEQIRALPEEDRERLIGTYAEETQENIRLKIRRLERFGKPKRSLEDITSGRDEAQTEQTTEKTQDTSGNDRLKSILQGQ